MAAPDPTSQQQASAPAPVAGKASLPPQTWPLLRRLWRERVRAHRRTIGLILFFIVLGAGANSLYPLLVREAFQALEARDMGILTYAPLVVLLVTGLKGGSLFMQQVLTNGVVTRVEADMQSALYAHLIDADLAQLDREHASALTQRFTTDFAFIREALTRLFTVFLRDIAMVVGLIGVMIWIDPWSTLIAVLVAPVLIPPIARIGRKLRRVATATQEEIGAMASIVSESLAGVRVAKTYALEPYLKGRAARAFEDVRDLKMKAANARARLDPLLEIGAGVAVAAVIVFVGWRIAAGTTTLGDFAAYTGALLMAAQPVRTLGNLNAIVQEALAALTRYFAILDEKPRIDEKPAAPALAVTSGALRFEAVSFRYREDAPALERVDLDVPAGGVTALVGRSGSGKSTLMALVPRLYDATAGRVLIDGQDVRGVSIASLRRHIAMVSQDVTLFDDTVRANIAFGWPDPSRPANDAAIMDAARAAAAHEFISRLPEGYDTRVGAGGSRLSGGERQRVALARAILKDAPILLLDEATSALDAESEKLVQEALARLMQGRTTLVIAHRLSTVRQADQIVVMDRGRIAELGRHDELVARGGVYARLHQLQLTEN